MNLNFFTFISKRKLLRFPYLMKRTIILRFMSSNVTLYVMKRKNKSVNSIRKLLRVNTPLFLTVQLYRVIVFIFQTDACMRKTPFDRKEKE